MKKFIPTPLALVITCMLSACSDQHSDHTSGHTAHEHDEKPIQHLKLDNILSLEEATTVFANEVAFIIGKKELTAGALHEIHMSTYSLEKAVAYFAENTEGESQNLAEQIAVVVEEIHLASENNRTEDTRGFIDQLDKLAQIAGSFRDNY